MLLLNLLYLVTVGAAFDEKEMTRFEYSQPHMGTTFRIVFYDRSKEHADAAAEKVWKLVTSLNAKFTDYEDKSELTQLCMKAGTGPVPVSKEMFEILKKSQEVAKLSRGTFDVTAGPMIQLWRISRREKKLPPQDKVDEAKNYVGYQRLTLHEEGQHVSLEKKGMRLDLGGIGKGYTADKVLELLRAEGIPSAMLVAGGDVAVSKKPPGSEGWKVEIWPNGKRKDKLPKQLLMEDMAVSTSGDAEQFVLIDGKKYSHLVDTRTGLGITGSSGATVVAKKGIDADAHTKMVAILGPEEAMKIIDAMSGFAAMYFSYADEAKPVLIYSKAWAGLNWR